MLGWDKVQFVNLGQFLCCYTLVTLFAVLVVKYWTLVFLFNFLWHCLNKVLTFWSILAWLCHRFIGQSVPWKDLIPLHQPQQPEQGRMDRYLAFVYAKFWLCIQKLRLFRPRKFIFLKLSSVQFLWAYVNCSFIFLFWSDWQPVWSSDAHVLFCIPWL